MPEPDINITFAPQPQITVTQEVPDQPVITVAASPKLYVSALGSNAKGFVWKGSWSSGTNYYPYDVAQFLGSSYVSLSANTNVSPALDNGSNWQLMASSGQSLSGGVSIVTEFAAGSVPALPSTNQTNVFFRGDASYSPVSYSSLTGVPSTFPTNWGSISGIPSTFTPSSHGSTHVSTDPIPKATMGHDGFVPYLVAAGSGSGQQTQVWLRGDNAWNPLPMATTGQAGLITKLSGFNQQFLRGDGTFNGVPYSGLIGIPSSFTPSAHHTTHEHGGADQITILYSDLSGVPATFAPTLPIPWAGLSGVPSTFPPTVPIDWSNLTSIPSTFPPTTPIPWSDLSGVPSTFPPTTPIAWSDISGVPSYVPLAGGTMTGTLTISDPGGAGGAILNVEDSTNNRNVRIFAQGIIYLNGGGTQTSIEGDGSRNLGIGGGGGVIFAGGYPATTILSADTTTGDLTATATAGPSIGNTINLTHLANNGIFSTTAYGFVPTSPGGTTDFLRADGTWAAPTPTPPATSMGVFIESPTNKTYTLDLDAPSPYTVIKLSIVTVSGTCTVALNRNGTAITGASAVSVSSTLTTITLNQACVAGDTLTMVVSSNSSAVDLSASVRVQP